MRKSRKKGLIALLLVAVVVAIVLIASSGSGDKGYVVRAIFDNGSFMVQGEQVRIAGANVGEIEEVDVTRPGEVGGYENGKPKVIPGKAVIVMKITDPGFQDFREDASCEIRPQSLIGEKYVDCRPTLPRAPGTQPPPPLREIGSGQPGAGELLLPLENNSSSVDPDLINDIQTLPYAQRFRLIFNELGATLAGRGSDVAAAVKRANPDLRDADRLLQILAEQKNELAQLAVDSERVTRPLAEQRRHVAGFFSNAGAAGQATAERGAELEASLSKFPQFLREFRTTMRNLQGFSDAATPVFQNLDRATPALTEATRNLTPFTAASTVALKSLGNAGEASGPIFRAADPIVKKSRNLARSGVGPTTNLAKFLVSTKKTKGFDNLVDLIYNGTGATNEFDKYGHLIRSLVTLQDCAEYVIAPKSGCHATFDSEGGASAFDSAAVYARIQEELAKRSGGTAATTLGPSTFLNPSAPAEPTPELGEGEAFGLGLGGEAGEAAEEASRRSGPALPSLPRPARPPRLPPRTVKDRSGIQGIASNPVLVGAVTVLVILVAVFLAYNANNGLPFVSTYNLKARVPNAQALVKGNEVRIGGARVGVVKSVKPVELKNGNFAAELSLSLDKVAQPVPVDSTLVIRPRSPLGLKYVQIEPGDSSKGFEAGETIPVSASRPESVDIDEFFSMFNEETRHAIRQNEAGFGNAFAGRGPQLNAAFGSLRKLAESAQAPLANLVAPSTNFAGFWRALQAFNATLAPVAEINGTLFVALDRTFAAFARVSRPYIQETISKGPQTLDTAIADLPAIDPFLQSSERFFAAFEPGSKALADSSPILNAAQVAGIPVLKASPVFQAQLEPTAKALLAFQETPGVFSALNLLIDTNQVLGPPIKFIAPAQSTCNYLTLAFGNVGNALSENNGQANWAGALALEPPTGPNNEGGASSAPANGGSDRANHLHYNPYPNTASPGQSPQECEAGNEPYTKGVTTIGNAPGNQGLETRGQLKEGE